MKILFVDPVCPKPYDPKVLATEALGGTEATVIRIAEALASKDISVVVKQHCRKNAFNENAKYPVNPEYVPFGTHEDYRPTHVVVLRAPQILPQIRRQFPTTKLYLWCHDIFAGPAWHEGFKAVVETGTIPIVVSEWHRSQMYDAIKQLGINTPVSCQKIYNPIADDLVPDETLYDKNKLVFFSSPHKGLKHTLDIFSKFSNFEGLKDVKLYIANPGYFKDYDTEGLKNVVNLGAISHAEVIRQVRSSLAVFHLNSVFPETFGLVHAEANAVGTPFLTSRFGASYELCDHPGELIDVSDTKAVIDRITQWREQGRPKVRGNVSFKTHKILKEWLGLLSR